MTVGIPPLTRPSGKRYWPRKVEATTVWTGFEDGEMSGVYVFGTHDIEFSRGHAQAALDAANKEILEIFGPGSYLFELTTAEPGWVGTSPYYDTENERMTRSFKDDTERGRGCVKWKVSEYEHTPSAEDRPDGIMPPPLEGIDL